MLISRKHERGWEGAAPESDAGCSVQRGCPRVDAASEFFFLKFTPTRLDSRRIGLIQLELELARIAISGRIGRQPKQAEIGLDSSQKSQNSHLRGIVMCFLPSSFFVL